ETLANDPPKLPIGVRTAETINTSLFIAKVIRPQRYEVRYHFGTIIRIELVENIAFFRDA
ncbi:MAG: hypothetical protein RL664_722, partial [Bacteroidota bacterium]